MLDIELLRKDFENVSKGIATRAKDYPQLSEFKKTDTLWRNTVSKIQDLNTERNSLTKEIATFVATKQTTKVDQIKDRVRVIKEEIADLEKHSSETEAQLNLLLHSIPNIPHKSVPIGSDETQNVEVRK
jgi:seryl-tRNA synthetase